MSISDKMREYLENTPRKQVLKVWAKSKKYDSIGPTVDQFMSFHKRVRRRFRLGKQIGRKYVKIFSTPEWYRTSQSERDFYRLMYNMPYQCQVKCLTFNQDAQDALPDEIKARMKANQEKAKKKI